MPVIQQRLINPKKLLLSKWTAVHPVNKEKHFMVVKLLEPELPDLPLEWVEIEAVYSGRIQTIAWQQLKDSQIWRQGWC